MSVSHLCVHVCVCVYVFACLHVHVLVSAYTHGDQKTASGPLEWSYRWYRAAWDECCDLNLGPLQEQQVLLTSEASLYGPYSLSQRPSFRQYPVIYSEIVTLRYFC